MWYNRPMKRIKMTVDSLSRGQEKKNKKIRETKERRRGKNEALGNTQDRGRTDREER